MNIGTFCVYIHHRLSVDSEGGGEVSAARVNGAYPSGSSSVDSTRAVALVDKLPWSLDVKLTADRQIDRQTDSSVCYQ